MPSAPTFSLTGQPLGKFQVGRRLGVGGVREIYEAEDTLLARTAALKVLNPQVATDGDAFRQQLSRARRKFADFLIAEFSQTLRDPNRGKIRDELAELGLLPDVENLPSRICWKNATPKTAADGFAFSFGLSASQTQRVPRLSIVVASNATTPSAAGLFSFVGVGSTLTAGCTQHAANRSVVRYRSAAVRRRSLRGIFEPLRC
jgi:serine/threonine protein kinase